jgi:hypothetical protein
MQVVGLTGFAGAGKSTAADYLVGRYGFTRVSFAAPLKKMLRNLDPILGAEAVTDNAGRFVAGTVRLSYLFNELGWTEQQIKDSVYGKEYRELAQKIGTDCVRAEEEDFWIRAAERQMPDPAGKYVFDDCRFPNEAQFVVGKSPLGLWNVEREGIHAVNGHVSEQHAGKMGETIWLFNGTGQLEFLHDQIDNAVDMAFQGVNA